MGKRITPALFIILFLGSYLCSNEIRDLNQIKESGFVRVGFRRSPTVYMEDEKTGKPNNYVWDLIQAWAEENGVEAHPVVLDTMTDYWEFNGKIPENVSTDDSIVYTPDIYSKIDIAADIFTRLEWRERLVDMHKYIETGSIAVTRKEDNVSKPEDLIGKRFYLVRGQSGFNLVLGYLKNNNLNFNEINVEYLLDENGLTVLDYSNTREVISNSVVNLIVPLRSPRTYKLRPLAFYQWLLNDQVDILLNNSLTFFIYNMKNSSLRRYLEPTLALSDNLQEMCLASSKDTPELSRSLDSFLEDAQLNGLNDRLLLKHAGIGLDEYNQLIRK